MPNKGFAVFTLSLVVASSALDAKAHKKTSSASCPDPGITKLSSTSTRSVSTNPIMKSRNNGCFKRLHKENIKRYMHYRDGSVHASEIGHGSCR